MAVEYNLIAQDRRKDSDQCAACKNRLPDDECAVELAIVNYTAMFDIVLSYRDGCNQCEREQPVLKLVKSHVLRCLGCHIWVERLPQWYNAELGKGWQCGECGTTSISIHEGRPFGPRSQRWQELVDEFEEYYEVFHKDIGYWDWILSTVVVKHQEGEE